MMRQTPPDQYYMPKYITTEQLYSYIINMKYLQYFTEKFQEIDLQAQTYEIKLSICRDGRCSGSLSPKGAQEQISKKSRRRSGLIRSCYAQRQSCTTSVDAPGGVRGGRSTHALSRGRPCAKSPDREAEHDQPRLAILKIYSGVETPHYDGLGNSLLYTGGHCHCPALLGSSQCIESRSPAITLWTLPRPRNQDLGKAWDTMPELNPRHRICSTDANYFDPKGVSNLNCTISPLKLVLKMS